MVRTGLCPGSNREFGAAVHSFDHPKQSSFPWPDTGSSTPLRRQAQQGFTPHRCRPTGDVTVSDSRRRGTVTLACLPCIQCNGRPVDSLANEARKCSNRAGALPTRQRGSVIPVADRIAVHKETVLGSRTPATIGLLGCTSLDSRYESPHKALKGQGRSRTRTPLSHIMWDRLTDSRRSTVYVRVCMVAGAA